MKPMLAADWDESKIRFPVIAQPKIDGVRGLNVNGLFTGRSLKRHANRHVTNLFSRVELDGLDGEIAALHECHVDLCRETTSALSTIEGDPSVVWWLFDYVTESTKNLPYSKRLAALAARVDALRADPALPELSRHLRCVPSVICADMAQLLKADAAWLDMGYEGTIIRDPAAPHKQGRSTVREGGLLRIKRFIDGEVEVVELIEGETNLNDLQINELGRTFRSGRQANMMPNGMVGAMLGRLINDVRGLDGSVLFAKGAEIKISAGCMSHEDRFRHFHKPELLIGQVAKFKSFPKGVKDKPRFPTFQSLRCSADM